LRGAGPKQKIHDIDTVQAKKITIDLNKLSKSG